MSLFQEALDTCAALTRKVEHLEHDKVRTSHRIESSDDTIMEDVSNQGRMIDELDKDEGAVLMSENEEKETEEVQDITGNAQVEGRQAEIFQINMDHAVKVLSMQEDEPEIQEAVEYFKGMSYNDIRPIFKAKFNSNIEFLLKSKEQIEEEDLESLWSIVKERFSTSKPNNFLDDFLLTTLKAMFGRPDGQDQIWMNQRSVHVA
nr:hypothetical protein [Tanacetum cinerariifolium]